MSKLKILLKHMLLWYEIRNNLLTENGKLRTYLKIKANFGFEKYLSILHNFQYRQVLSKFRISNHKLRIETGRYSRPLIELEDRVCNHCFSDDIETEEHFLITCNFYNYSRKPLLDAMKYFINDSNLSTMTSSEKLFWILNYDDADFLIIICDFVLCSHCLN